MRRKRITVRLDDREQSLLTNVSRRENKAESEIVREALSMYFKSKLSQTSCYDLAKYLEIIGVSADLPSDLSTNSDYFQDFGR